MTEQEALDTAARAVGRLDWADACRYDMGSVTACIRAHAASLQRIAELEAKLSSLTPSEEEREQAKEYLAAYEGATDAAALIRKYVLQEQPIDPLVEAIEAIQFNDHPRPEDYAKELREALARRGLAIVKEGV